MTPEDFKQQLCKIIDECLTVEGKICTPADCKGEIGDCPINGDANLCYWIVDYYAKLIGK